MWEQRRKQIVIALSATFVLGAGAWFYGASTGANAEEADLERTTPKKVRVVDAGAKPVKKIRDKTGKSVTSGPRERPKHVKKAGPKKGPRHSGRKIIKKNPKKQPSA